MKLYAAIPLVMERFDFAKIHRVMTFLDWKWANASAGYAVPSVDDLKSEAYRQLHDCVRLYERHGLPKTGMNVSCGGFQALVMTFEHGEPQLQLIFYVEEISSNGEF